MPARTGNAYRPSPTAGFSSHTEGIRMSHDHDKELSGPPDSDLPIGPSDRFLTPPMDSAANDDHLNCQIPGILPRYEQPPDLTEEDERIFTEIWEQIGKEEQMR